MKLYFAGADNSRVIDKLLIKCGVQNRLNSYHYLSTHYLAPPTHVFNFLLDSGGFSARNRGVAIKVEDYAEYVNRHECTLIFNLDTNDVDETLANQKFLQAATKSYVLPIYHFSDYIDATHKGLLDDFVQEYPYIALGGVAGRKTGKNELRAFYDHVFSKTTDRIKVHGLGITTETFLARYPWYSVDSTSWQSLGRYGHSKFAESVELARFRANKRHYIENFRLEIKGWLKLEKDMTALWKKRGVIWEEKIEGAIS